MQNCVFVLNSDGSAANPVHASVARRLLRGGQAAVIRRVPFIIVLKEGVTTGVASDIQIKIDPGSKVTGFAIVQREAVIWCAELVHRGHMIRDSLQTRAACRRGRRQRNTRYRAARFLNRTKPEGWLPPSLMHRVHTVVTWVRRLMKWTASNTVMVETVRFDLQLLENPEIGGVQYQQGTLHGYEVREYLLEKFDRTCCYCRKSNLPLQIEHIIPRSRGGSDRISNLCLACQRCNQKKGSMTAVEFGFPQVQASAMKSFADAAAVNATRFRILGDLTAIGANVMAFSGGRTKYNRTRLQLPKEHWIDAACVGKVDTLAINADEPLRIECMGHQARQMVQTDKYGFPRKKKDGSLCAAKSQSHGFRCGDLVEARQTAEENRKKTGCVRAIGRANLDGNNVRLTLDDGTRRKFSKKFCRVVQRNDGYSYKHANQSTNVVSNADGQLASSQNEV